MKLALYKSDTLGALASALCMIHCLATPFLFIAQTCSASCCDSSPQWWQWMDYFFLVISFFAVYRSSQTTTNKLMIPALWVSWGILFTVLVNKEIQYFSLPNIVMYVIAIVLAMLHLYNLKYCQCKKCCTNHD